MDHNKTIFTETYKVRSTQVNLNNQLGLYGVLGMLQDIAYGCQRFSGSLKVILQNLKIKTPLEHQSKRCFKLTDF